MGGVGSTRNDMLLEANGQVYSIDKVLGEGGLSKVYGGKRLWDGRPVAIKRLNKPSPGHMASIENEVILLNHFGRLHPELFIRVYDVVFAPRSLKSAALDASPLNTLFVIMEKGTCLYDILAQQITIPEPERSAAFIHMALAIEVMHEHGIVHGDIKSENFVLCPDGNLKIIDLGNSTAMPPMAAEIIGKVAGTRRYMPPEKKAFPPVHGYAADIYSLGVILYRMSFGLYPRGPIKSGAGENMLLLLSGGNEKLVSLLKQMMHRDYRKRPTIQQVLYSRYVLSSGRKGDF